MINALDGQEQLMVRILYGTGLRLLELLRLRVKDVDFGNGFILVRCGKGMKDRITVLPDSVRAPLEAHIASVRRLHERDVKRGGGHVELPYALGRSFSARHVTGVALAVAVGISGTAAVCGYQYRAGASTSSSRVSAAASRD